VIVKIGSVRRSSGVTSAETRSRRSRGRRAKIPISQASFPVLNRSSTTGKALSLYPWVSVTGETCGAVRARKC
jgi:hypothetical protein